MSKDVDIFLVPVSGHNQLGRDPSSNAIINTDQSAYDAYKRARREAKRKEEEMSSLRSEVGELKELVKSLAKKVDK
jgi:hypothetical protein|tara:strand:- start:1433 stop:1660 length:228 start_codon:yes stop_codon:yes gene_type:complete